MVQPALIAFANLYAFNSPFLGLLFFLLNWLFSFIYLHNPFFTRIFLSSLIFSCLYSVFRIFTRCFLFSLTVSYFLSLIPIFTRCFLSSLTVSYLHSLFHSTLIDCFVHPFLLATCLIFY